MKKKTLFSIIVLSLVFVAASITKVQAGVSHNSSGWLLGASDDGAGNPINIGWISMNSLNCDVDGDGVYTGSTEGAPVGCPTSGLVANGFSGWGVNIPTDGSLASGYAWSSAIGWVSFNQADLSGCPSGTCSARMESGSLKGWARIMSIVQAGANAGGWNGWISLSGTNYGITYNDVSGALSGFAWSNELGWIDFSGAKITPPPTVSLSASPMTINVDNISTFPWSENIDLTWTVSGATSCSTTSDNGTWNNVSVDATDGSYTDSASVDSSMPTVKFTISCKGPGDLTVASQDVTTVCYEHVCGSDVCSAVGKFGIPSSSSCTTQSCENDSECQGISAGNWREVSP